MNGRRTLPYALWLLLYAQGFGQESGPLRTVGIAARILTPVAATTTGDMAGEFSEEIPVGELEVEAGAPAGKGKSRALRPASFNVRGKGGGIFALMLPGDSTCVLRAPGASIPVKNFKVSVGNAPPTANPGALTLDGNGKGAFQVGMTLVVASRLPRGLYSGYYNLTMVYN